MTANAFNAQELLKSLRWKADMLVTNAFGEKVWLGPCYNEAGEHIGITDCCFADMPCSHHQTADMNTVKAAISAARAAAEEVSA